MLSREGRCPITMPTSAPGPASTPTTGRITQWWWAGLSAVLLLATLTRPLAADPDGHVTLQLKWYHQFQFAGYYAALDQGFYAAEGLEVTIVPGDADHPPIPTVLGGKADFGVGDAEVLLARLRGDPVVVCAAVFQHSPYVLLSRRERGVFTPSDLPGKRVMVSADQGAAQFWAMLAREGIDPKLVTELQHSWNLDDLVAGRVDAVSAYASVEPFQLRARGVEPAILRSADYGIDFYGDTLFTTEHQAHDHPEQTAAFVRASRRGWEYAFHHPEEMVDRILQLPGVRERGITRELLVEEARVMRDLVLPDLVEIGHMNAGRWRRIAEIFVEQGLAPRGSDEAHSARLSGFLFAPGQRDLTLLWWAFAVAGASVLGLLVVSQWNRQMARQVKARTAELADEIVQRRQVEQELRVSEERFREIAENIREVFWATDLGKREMVYVSPAYETIWGRSCASLYRDPWSWLEAIHPEDRERVAALAQRQEQGGYDTVFRIVRPDGELRWIRDRAYPIAGPDGEVYRVVGTAEDITDRRVIEEQLREQASLLDLTGDAILVTDLDRTIRYWNRGAERTYGWTSEEASGRRAGELLGDEGVREGAWEATLAQGEWQGELNHLHARGSRLLVQSRWSLVRDEQGAPRSVLEIDTDITERRRFEQQLYRAQRLESLGTLSGGIAHDLNNLLAPILMGVELIEHAAPNESVREVLRTIERSAKRGSDLVKQVLAFSRGIEGARVPVLVADLLRELRSIVESSFPKNIELRFDVAPRMWPVQGDLTQLSQVLLNLAVNARDAMPQGGHLAVRARNLELADERVSGLGTLGPGRYVVLEVVDDGSGISAENLERIFDPFFTTKPLGKGTGLGLSTVLGIVRSHGGVVEVESQLGQGTTFRLNLPASVPELELGPQGGRDAQAARGQGQLLLLVDDEPAIRELAQRTLERAGYRVLTAAHGAEGLAVFASHRQEVQLVITDLMMPVMDGTALVQTLREQGCGLPVIAVSGLAADEATLAALGPCELLAKPYTGEALLRAVAMAVAPAARSTSAAPPGPGDEEEAGSPPSGNWG
jgi:PAS domain S-box-containing protein